MAPPETRSRQSCRCEDEDHHFAQHDLERQPKGCKESCLVKQAKDDRESARRPDHNIQYPSGDSRPKKLSRSAYPPTWQRRFEPATTKSAQHAVDRRSFAGCLIRARSSGGAPNAAAAGRTRLNEIKAYTTNPQFNQDMLHSRTRPDGTVAPSRSRKDMTMPRLSDG